MDSGKSRLLIGLQELNKITGKCNLIFWGSYCLSRNYTFIPLLWNRSSDRLFPIEWSEILTNIPVLLHQWTISVSLECIWSTYCSFYFQITIHKILQYFDNISIFVNDIIMYTKTRKRTAVLSKPTWFDL